MIQEEIKTRLKWGNACYHSIRNHLSPCLLSKNVKIRIYESEVLPVVWYEYETCSLTSRKQHRLREFENRMLRRISEPKRL
jgi:hypothetical protein